MTLALGTAGGAAFNAAHMPLAWMLGAMLVTTGTALAGGRLLMPSGLRSGMITILGVLLGSQFTPEVIERARQWPLTLACLAVYLVLVVAVLFWYFHRVIGFDPVTAFFSAAPGGLNVMTIQGAALGGDDRSIALVHASRILLVALTIPFWFRFTTGVVTTTSSVGPSVRAIGLFDVSVLAACAVLGLLVGQRVRLPAHHLVGPMIASALVHATGITHSTPPWQLVAAAQVVLGCGVGARFAGVSPWRVLHTIGASLASAVVMIGGTVAFAFGLAHATGLDWRPLVLAYSPGGLAEMSLIALALGIETAFVATHHVARIGIIVLGAPFVFRLARRIRGRLAGINGVRPH